MRSMAEGGAEVQDKDLKLSAPSTALTRGHPSPAAQARKRLARRRYRPLGENAN
jgi:hypothetical protein